MRKRCLICGLNKDFDEFNQMKSSKDGKQVYCKICMNDLNKKWRLKNAENTRKVNVDIESILKYAPVWIDVRKAIRKNEAKRREKKRYKIAHPEKIRESKRRYRKAHPEKIQEKSHRYRKAHLEKIQEKSRRYYKANMEKVREYSKKAGLELKSFYVKHIIREKYKIPGELISKEMIRRERELIKINRTVKELRNNGKSKTDRRGNVGSVPDEELRSLFSLLS